MNQTKLRNKAAQVSQDLGLMGDHGAERIYDALLRVLLEERERCAQVAELGDPTCSECKADPQCCACPDTAKLIAKKIRESARAK